MAVLTLEYAAPYDWPAMLSFFAARAIAGVERVEHGRYRRVVELGGRRGTIEVGPVAGRNALAATIRFPQAGAVARIAARLRRMFDLDCDIGRAAAHLSRDRRLRPLLKARPGLRVPGAWDPFELAVRAILGQQVTIAAARQLAGRLVAAHGTELAPPRDGLTAAFPRPERLARADLRALGMPRARAAALSALSAAVAADAGLLERDGSLEDTVARLRGLPGVGEWTAQYIALRALRHPDAFPASDIGLLRAMAEPDGSRPRPAQLLERAQAWRPWRAYAAQHLWTADAAATTARKGAVA